MHGQQNIKRSSQIYHIISYQIGTHFADIIQRTNMKLHWCYYIHNDCSSNTRHATANRKRCSL